MKVASLRPPPAQSQVFDLKWANHIPQGSGCYVLAAFSDEILYIGETKSLRRRFKQHLNDNEKTNPTAKGRALHFYWLEAGEEKIAELENAWLQRHEALCGKKPILNKKGGKIPSV